MKKILLVLMVMALGLMADGFITKGVNGVKSAGGSVVSTLKGSGDTITDFLNGADTGIMAIADEESIGVYASKQINNRLKLTISYMVYNNKSFNKSISGGKKASRCTATPVVDKCKTDCAPTFDYDSIINDNGSSDTANDTASDDSAVLSKESRTTRVQDDLDVIEVVGSATLFKLDKMFSLSALGGVGMSYNDTLDEYGTYLPMGLEVSSDVIADLDIGISYRKNIDINNMHVDEDLVTLKLGWSF